MLLLAVADSPQALLNPRLSAAGCMPCDQSLGSKHQRATALTLGIILHRRLLPAQRPHEGLLLSRERLQGVKLGRLQCSSPHQSALWHRLSLPGMLQAVQAF